MDKNLEDIIREINENWEEPVNLPLNTNTETKNMVDTENNNGKEKKIEEKVKIDKKDNKVPKNADFYIGTKKVQDDGYINKKVKYGIIGLAVLLVVVIAISSFNSKINDLKEIIANSQVNNSTQTETIMPDNNQNNDNAQAPSIDNLKGNIIKEVEIDGTKVGNIEYIAEQTMPSVVSVSNLSVQQTYDLTKYYYYGQTEIIEQETTSNGSGVIIGSNDKEIWIATNHHVIDGAKTITITFNTKESVSAYLKGYLKELDIAVVSVKLSDMSEQTKATIRTAKIGNSAESKIGSEIITIGNMLGYGQSVTTGIVSATNRQILHNEKYELTVLQIDAAINPGNSGGALLNNKGELIGIPMAKNTSQNVELMGYAIPINNILNQLKHMCGQEGRKTVPDAEATHLGIETIDTLYGVLVMNISPNTPAYKSDLQVGDYIIAINEQTVVETSDVKSELQYYREGESVTLKVKRPDGKTYEETTIKVILEKKK